MSVLYTLHCDGPGCLRNFEGVGLLKMPDGWSEFRGNATISNGEHCSPTIREIVKHYCFDCRERLRDHGVAPQETIVLGPDLLESGSPGVAKCECGFRWPPRSKYAACPKCGKARNPDLIKPRASTHWPPAEPPFRSRNG